MDIRKLEEGRQILCREYEDLVKRGGFSSASDVDKMYKVLCAIDKTYKIEMYEGGEHSQTGEWNAMGSYGRDNSYRGMSNYSGRRYRANGMLTEELTRMMDNSVNPDERETFRKALMIMERG